jgi:hypothetical protein
VTRPLRQRFSHPFSNWSRELHGYSATQTVVQPIRPWFSHSFSQQPTVARWLSHSYRDTATHSLNDSGIYTVTQPLKPPFSHSFSQWPTFSQWLSHSYRDSATHSASDPQLHNDSATHTVIQPLIQWFSHPYRDSDTHTANDPVTQWLSHSDSESATHSASDPHSYKWLSHSDNDSTTHSSCDPHSYKWLSQSDRDSDSYTVTQPLSDASLRSDSAAIQTINQPVGTAFNLRRIQAMTLPIREWRSQTRTQTLYISALASQLQSVTWYVNQSLIHSTQPGSHLVNRWFSHLGIRLISRPFVTWFNYSAIPSIDQACIHTSISRGVKDIPLLVAETG